MSVLNTGLAKTSAAAGGYSIDNSLRFNDDDSAYLSRTPSSAGNRKTWTFSCWVKRSEIDRKQILLDSDSGNELIYIHSPNELRLVDSLKTSNTINIATSQLFRDTSAWYHIIIAMDTTQATASDRTKIYVNGEQVTAFSASDYPTLNKEFRWNGTYLHHLGSDGGNYLDGYLAEVHFIDGQALDPTSFGETGDYGEWKPIEVTGMTYGTNGFYLDFKVAGTGTTGAGKDVSGEGNHWSTSGIASTDQMLDSPTNNFCTLNPIGKTGTLGVGTFSEGNLRWNGGGSPDTEAMATFSHSSGKWYWEGYALSTTDGIFIADYDNNTSSNRNKKWYGSDGSTGQYINHTYSAGTSISSWTTGDIIGVALDLDNDSVYFRKNDTWQNSGDPTSGSSKTGALFTTISGQWGAFVSDGSSGTKENIFNFGQDSSFAGSVTVGTETDDNSNGSFKYDPPSGFLALCTSNLSDPAVIPSEHFNTVLYTGNSSTNAITGVGFQPDFVWAKARSSAQSSRLVDAVRGTSNILNSDLTDVEYTGASYSFDSDGFTWSGGGGNANDNAVTYAAWNWKANGTGVSNTNGSITSTVSANADAGFSIVSYTGTGSNATVGHGLSVTPEMVIVTNRNYVSNWACLHSGIASDYETDYIPLNNATTSWDNNAYWNDTKPTNSLFSVGTDNDVNRSGDAHIAYCFHSVAQYSKVFSYTGNGSTDGTFVYCDFRPKYVMIKKLTGSYSWYIYDTSRNTYNVVGEYLFADSSSAEASATHLDILSNGFKIRTITNALNNNLNGYIGIAFAELPAKYNNAR